MRGKGTRIGAGALLALLCACSDYHTAPAGIGSVIGSGVLATEARAVSGFSAVSISHPARLIVDHAGTETLVVTAEDNILPLVRSEVSGGRLFLSLAAGDKVTSTREIVYRVTVAGLNDLEASGAARVELRGLRDERLGVRLSGASMLTAAGECAVLEIRLSGASRADTAALRSRQVIADLSGASYGLVRASESLVVNASGASTLEYLGDPLLVSNTSGGSVVRRVGP
jgi:hypothetical protein